MWGYQLHDRPFLDTLIQPSEKLREFVICSDINIPYVNENNQKNLISLLRTYNLSHTVNFATRTQNDFDIIFVDNIRISLYSTSPIINSLSDHAAQFPTVNNIVAAATKIVPLMESTRKINNETIMQFQLLLKNETWESIRQ
jgi:hypothetical protein